MFKRHKQINKAKEREIIFHGLGIGNKFTYNYEWLKFNRNMDCRTVNDFQKEVLNGQYE